MNLVSKKGESSLGAIKEKNEISSADAAALIRIRLDPIYIQLTEKDGALGIE